MINSIFILIFAIVLVVKGASFASKYATRLAESFSISEYTVGFIVIAFISILPETFIALKSAADGIPSFALGMLFGSNIADLTLIFSIIILWAGRGIKVEKKIMRVNSLYPFILLLPLILGLDGSLSRLEGAALLIAGGIFYYTAFKRDREEQLPPNLPYNRSKSFFLLLLGMAMLLLGAHFTVESATMLATLLGVSPIFIGMFIVALGTTIPELFFALKSVKKRNDSLAVGDILGTVLADATIVVGLLALVSPFSFPKEIIYVTGVFMVISSLILMRFMRSGLALSRREGFLLFIFWILFVLIEFIASMQ